MTNPADNHVCLWLGKNLRIVYIELTNDFEIKPGWHLIRGDNWYDVWGIRHIGKDGKMWELTT